ncbi:hypothetical protein Bca101_013426 [Brassica carinata]
MQRKYQDSLQEPKVKEEERGRRKLALAVVQWESINSLVVGVVSTIQDAASERERERLKDV